MTEHKGFILFILSFAQLVGLSLWFAPNAVINQLKDEFSLSDSDISILSISVTLGFVTGGLIFSIFNLPDVFKTKNFFFIAATLGALSNQITAMASSFMVIIISRYLTGIFLAGIYPVGMKLTASHFKVNRGLAVGILLGALTIGSGLPYVFNLVGTPRYQVVITAVSILSFIGGLSVFLFVDTGPHVGKSTRFSFENFKTIFRSRSVRLANYAYFGHMWELYAMWVWVPVVLQYSYLEKFPNASDTEVLRFFSLGTFLIFLVGGLGNAFGGKIADKFGRTKFNIVMLSISGSSALLLGFFLFNPYLTLLVALIWGATIVPDSPQYSTIVSEVADQNLVGSALTIQTAAGFLLTIVTIRMTPYLKSIIGWEYAFMYLALGPLLGIYSLLELRKEPDARLIANGKM